MPSAPFVACVALALSSLAHAGPPRIPTVPAGWHLRNLAFVPVGDLVRDHHGRLLGTVNPAGGTPRDGQVWIFEPADSVGVISDGYYNPVGLLLDENDVLYVVDVGPTGFTGDTDGCVWRDAGGGPTLLAGCPVSGCSPGQPSFTTPSDICRHPTNADLLLVSEVSTLVPLADGAIFSVNRNTGARTSYFNDGKGGLANTGSVFRRGPDVLAVDNHASVRAVVRIDSDVAFTRLTDLGLTDPFRAAVDANGVLYIGDSTQQKIFRCPITNPLSTPEPFIFTVGTPGAIHVESPTVIYFSDASGLWVAARCAADFNLDGIVNSTDVSDFINQWFTDQAKGTFITDWDGNGTVNSTDVSFFINAWFEQSADINCTG